MPLPQIIEPGPLLDEELPFENIDGRESSDEASGWKEGGRGMLDALTGDSGPLPVGACPAVLAASTEGQKAVLQALDDDKRAVKSKPTVPKKQKDEKEGKDLVPKTLTEHLPTEVFWF